MQLLNIDCNPKTVKGQKKGYMTAIMYLAPGNTSGYEVCPCRSKGCSQTCLFYAGRGQMSPVREARIRRTNLLINHPEKFFEQLQDEISRFIRRAHRKGFTPCVRLNGTSDIDWLSYGVPQWFPDVQFYDYTKVADRMFERWPDNYYLIFSRSEDNDEMCRRVLAEHKNVAVVFHHDYHPETHMGYPVVDGDESDLRFLDQAPVIVGLYSKGRARRDRSGFVVYEDVLTPTSMCDIKVV